MTTEAAALRDRREDAFDEGWLVNAPNERLAARRRD